MVMREVPLRRLEQLLFGSAYELRPTVAMRDPSVLSIDYGHEARSFAVLGHLAAPRRARLAL